MRKFFVTPLIAFLLFVSSGFAQNSQQTQPQPPAAATPAQQAPTSPQTQPSPQSQEPNQPPPQPQPSATPSHRLEVEPVEKDHQITPAEAKELFRSADEILRLASKDTGLPMKNKVKRTLVSRAQVEKY